MLQEAETRDHKFMKCYSPQLPHSCALALSLTHIISLSHAHSCVCVHEHTHAYTHPSDCLHKSLTLLFPQSSILRFSGIWWEMNQSPTGPPTPTPSATQLVSHLKFQIPRRGTAGGSRYQQLFWWRVGRCVGWNTELPCLGRGQGAVLLEGGMNWLL